MLVKLFDSELKVMEILWREGQQTAKELAKLLRDEVGWSKTTSYTVIKKCVAKQAIDRLEPNFTCFPIISRAETQAMETAELIEKMFDGQTDQLIASLVTSGRLGNEEIKQLRALIEGLDE